jgi:hypothetical protein
VKLLNRLRSRVCSSRLGERGTDGLAGDVAGEAKKQCMSLSFHDPGLADE